MASSPGIPSATTSAGSIRRALARLRRRAGGLLALRATALAFGAGTTAFAVVSAFAEPTIEEGRAALFWGLVVLAALAGAALGIRPLARLRGTGVARLLAGREGLASATRSALELATAPPTGAAPGLVAAHARAVERRVAAIPPAEVAPLSQLREPGTLGGLAATVLAALVLSGSDRASAGAFAMLHPGARDARGVSVADLVAELRYELVFPAYMYREPETREDEGVLRAPFGTTVVVAMRPRFPVAAATLGAPGQDVRLVPTSDEGGDGFLRGRFVVREPGRLLVRVTDAEGRRLRDARARSVEGEADAPPEVSLLAPEEDVVAELGEPVRLRFTAEDAIGLTGLQLVVRTAEGELYRRVLEDFEPGPAAPTMHEGVGRTSGAEVGARPGDRLELWVEARDGDVVHGPNVGRSGTRVLTIASDATRRAEALVQLEEARNLGLDALADRLEAPVPNAAAAARERQAEVRASASAYAGT
ncbi:MAG: hypothetical protein AAGH15_25375, partial [Myxococcota bacterium]